MKGYLLDTNILSYLAKMSFPALNHRFRALSKSNLVLSAVSEAEVRFGLALLPPEAKTHRMTETYLALIPVAPWDSSCARRYAPLAARQRQMGSSLSQLDTMIAAHALALELTLVTHDKAFTRIPGLNVEDWTEGPQAA